MGSLCKDDATANDIVKRGLVDHIQQVIFKRPEWKKFGLDSVRTLEKVCKYDTAVENLQKDKVLETMVDILTRKADEPKKEGVPSGEQNEEAKEKVIEKVKVEDKLTAKQEQELKDTAVSVLEKVVHQEELTHLKDKVPHLKLFSDFLA